MLAATLFSGIGAPETAMPEWHWPWHAEIERFPSAVMAARHPASANLGDVTADDFCERASAIARPDVIVFGSPCQDFSIAGKRLGLDGARGNLALAALRIIARLEPRWFVFENVPGLLSNWSGGPQCPPEPGSGVEGVENSDFAAFLGTVDELRYSGAWASLDAQYRGLAQRRNRLFFVGHSGDWRYPAAVLLEPESLCGDSPPHQESRQDVAGALGAGSPRNGSRVGRREAAAGQIVAPALNAGMGKRRGSGAHGDALAFGGNNTQGPIDVATAVNAHGGPHGRLDFESETLIAFDCKAGGKTSFSINDLPGSLRGEGFGGGHAAVALDTRKDSDYAVTKEAGPVEALRALRDAIQGRATSAVRRLTPRECERLQGFPDDYTLIRYRGKPAADGPRYKALGNSMAVPVLRWILGRIQALEEFRLEAAE